MHLSNTANGFTSIHPPHSSMPGSIQVSVLDFKELPSSSSSSSNRVKLSLGKVEHEAGEKGTFTFPLTNLRDNLIITIQDSEGNQVSQSGVRTTSIIEKGTWDDVFPIEGGGLIHMKLQFFLNDEERNRIRLMRELAMKKKQAEILGGRHEVSDVLSASSSQDFQKTGVDTNISLKTSESCDGIKEESFQGQSFTNVTDKSEETSFPHMTQEIEQKPNSSNNLVEKLYEETLKEKILNDVLETNEESSSNENNVILLRQAEVPENLLEDTENRDFFKCNNAVKSEIEQKPSSSNNLVENLYEETLKGKIPNDVKETNEESSSNKNNVILLRQAEVPEKLLEDTETRDFLKNNNAVKSEPLYNLVEKLDKQILEDKNPNFVKKMSKERKFPPLSKETEVNTIKNNEIQLQETNLLKRWQDSSSSDVGSSRLTVAEKIKSFSPKLAGEMDRQGSLEKTPQNIKKMIRVFESTISQDRVPLKSVSTKSYRFGNSRLLKDNTAKDYYEKSESSLKNSDKSSSSRLRNSFSTGDLRKSLSNIIAKGDEVQSDNNFVASSENMQSKGNDPNGAEKMEKEALNNEENLPKSPHEGVNNEKEIIDGRKTSKVNVDYFVQDGSRQWTFLGEKRQFCMTAQGDKAISLLPDCKIEEKGHQEKIVASTPEIVEKAEDIETPESEDVEASNGPFGQAMKIALVVGFGVLVLLFRQRESGKGKKNENMHALRNQVLMKRRGSIEEQGRKIGVSRLS